MNRVTRKVLRAMVRRALICTLRSRAGFIGTGMALGAVAGAVVWQVRR